MAEEEALARQPDEAEMQADAKRRGISDSNGMNGNAGESIEERCFSAALVCLEGHFTQSPPMGPLTAARVNSMISKTLEKTHTVRRARYGCCGQDPGRLLAPLTAVLPGKDSREALPSGSGSRAFLLQPSPA
jgi:hypothetical protein